MTPHIISILVKTDITEHYSHATHADVNVVVALSMHCGPIVMEICFFGSHFNHNLAEPRECPALESIKYSIRALQLPQPNYVLNEHT